MKKYRSFFFIVALSFLVAFLLYYFTRHSDLEESITYFPEDSELSYIYNKTTLTIEPQNQSKPFKILWQTGSKTNQKVYLREDVSLLFKNGRLASILSKWRKNAQTIHQEKTLSFHDSGHFEAITIHHAEKHTNQNVYTGKDIMSYDQRYVMAPKNQPISFFKVPVTPEELGWYHVLDSAVKQDQQEILEEASKQFHIHLASYYIFPLTYLHIYNQNTLPGLDKKTSHRAVSQLWEGLYKNYILGIKLKENQTENPIGSSVPFILYDKNSTHFLIITKTASGKLALFKQKIKA
ncbi:hypothetical protein JOD45_002591 [Scopulibacillus daqui]|uniref:Uncharacterized protein n=1 Tax=Scopulibacillus daqui TaxID=1469162 RepID=A0ABS2Q237_9BACL|nr:hypothetical protein [Scopulibacillus daqui]MBM7646363.1 hypothetical protein [Scopulibacillus daqui]